MQFNLKRSGTGGEVRTSDEMVRAWLELETSEPQFQLDGGFSRLDFVTDLSARKLVASAFSVSDRALSASRGARDGGQEQLHALLELYRERVMELFPKGHDLRERLPVLDLRPGPKPWTWTPIYSSVS
jgi:hypothetical protein